MTGVDISGVFNAVLSFVIQMIKAIVSTLDAIYIIPGISLFKLFIAITVIGLILSAIFVRFESGDEDD